MKGIIPKHFINELLHQTNIIDVIKERISLKRSGKNYNALCPFHKENTPSFTINREKQFYYCFGCHVHGNTIDFLMNYDKLTFIESIEELANINGLKIPYTKEYPTQIFNYEQRNNLYLIIEKISYIYHNNIFQEKYAYEYLVNRGIHISMIQYFRIGFSTKNLKNIEKTIKINNFKLKELIETGILLINKNGYKYDRLQERIIFPIRNKNGKVIGFGGRSIKKNNPKYINSPETQIFQKSRNIYGLFEVLKQNPKPKKLLVVEGYLDVITLFQFKINYSIALLGTFITSYQIQLLFRVTNTIIYCYDGDIAGKKAAWRTLKITLPYINDGKNIKFIFLPHGEDPDTIIRKEGKEKFKKRIKNATNLSKFLFKKLFKNIDLSSVNERFYLCSKTVPFINQIPGKITRIHLLYKLGTQIGIPDINVLKKLNTEKIYNENCMKKNEYTSTEKITIRILIGLLLQNPQLVNIIPSTKFLRNFQSIGLFIFLDLIKKCIAFPNSNTGQILETYRNTKIFDKLNQLATWNHMIAENQIPKVFSDSLKNLYNRTLENKKNKLIIKERQIGLKKDEKNELWLISKKLTKRSLPKINSLK
ncbi:MAG: DNA primase [Buchnera aphidicola (Nurudea yanoniella)]